MKLAKKIQAHKMITLLSKNRIHSNDAEIDLDNRNTISKMEGLGRIEH